MLNIKDFINKLSNFQKVICLISILGFLLMLLIAIPTLARYKNRNPGIDSNVWDGSIATSYNFGEGTEANPYIISNGSELAYFYKQLLNTDYQDTYFILSKDIILNSGVLTYDINDGIQYVLDTETYYVDYYSGKYYEDIEMSGKEKGTLNILKSLNGFKGHFDGNYHAIYGLYMADKNTIELALFTNLQGYVNNLYVENSIIYGGLVTAGIASTTSNASISNVLFDGFVIGKQSILTNTSNFKPEALAINLQSTETTNYIDLTNNIPFIGSEIISTTVSGNYTLTNANENNTVIKINGVTVTNGVFELDLGSSIIDNIPVVTSTTSEETSPTIELSNLNYKIIYNYAASGGIVAISNNTSINNTINKAYVYGYSTGGGLVGVATSSLNINQSYNTGNINGLYVSGGLIGTIEKSEDNITISKSYNTGNIAASNIGGIIGFIDNNPGTITISDIFNTSSTNYSIGTINNTIVNVNNAYFVNGEIAVHNGSTNGNFSSVTLDNLKTRDYVINTLSFSEFIDLNDLALNAQNVWIYENQELPILFIDDLTHPIANINASVYSWNNFSDELTTIFLYSNMSFSIEASDELIPIKEKYYYISESAVALSKEQVSQITSWTPYTDIVQISEDGIYVIYVKVVDYDDKVTYLNTDIFNLEIANSLISVGFANIKWSKFKTDLDYLHIDRPDSLTIEISERLPVTTIEYYISDEIKNIDDLNSLDTSYWTTYSNGISIYQSGTYIVYVKVTDIENDVTYVNTDFIVLNGYNEDILIIGKNPSSYINEEPYITNKSSITLNINYSNSSLEYLTGYSHNLLSSILLPLGTKITLIDNINSKIYEYKITTSTDIYNYEGSCSTENCNKFATYPLSLFKETGTEFNSKPFMESFYYNNGTINEDFTVILDLYDTEISTNYQDVMLYMELHDSKNYSIIPTLYSTIKKFSIYSKIDNQNTDASLKLTTNYNDVPIIYNSNSITNINITSGLDYKYKNSHKVIDTTYEDKMIGLSVKLVDSNGNTMTKEYLKNMTFKVGDNLYYPKDDGIVRINFNNGISDTTKDLSITTYVNNSNIDDGEYYIKISNYASYDGLYYDNLNDNEISIPVIITSNYNVAHSFNVVMDDLYRIINKNIPNIKMAFDILQSGDLEDPNIKVSLYKKDELTAYTQSYSILDLADYVSDELDEYSNNVYYVSRDPLIYNGNEDTYNHFELNLITSDLENTGYKFIFDLYDGTRKIGTIAKHFIVK